MSLEQRYEELPEPAYKEEPRPAAETYARATTDELFRAHAPFVARMLERMGVRREDLDDAVQEVFLVAHRNGGYLPGAAKPTTYLARIAFRTALAERRRRGRRRARHCEQPPEELAALDCDPGRALEVREALSQVDHALETLSPTLRATLWLADGEGESCVSIAAASEVPVGTVYWRLDRARKQFREALRRLDTKRGSRGALGVVGLLGAGDGSAPELLSARVLSSVRLLSSTTYDVASGLSRLRAAVLQGGPAAVGGSVTSALLGAKKMAVLAAVTLGVAGALTLSPPSAPPPRTDHVMGTPASGAAAAAAPTPPASPPQSAPHPRGGQVQSEPAATRTRTSERGPTVRSRALREGPATAMTARSDVAAKQSDPQTSEPAPPPSAAEQPEPPEPTPAPKNEARREPSPSEAAQVARAARLLKQQPHAALEAVRSIATASSTEYLLEERDYLEIMALVALGRRDEAHPLADAFLHRYPASAFASAIRKVARAPGNN